MNGATRRAATPFDGSLAPGALHSTFERARQPPEVARGPRQAVSGENRRSGASLTGFLRHKNQRNDEEQDADEEQQHDKESRLQREIDPRRRHGRLRARGSPRHARSPQWNGDT